MADVLSKHYEALTITLQAGRGTAADPLRQVGCALTVKLGDAQAISAAIAELLGDAERMRVLGERSKRLAYGPIFTVRS